MRRLFLALAALLAGAGAAQAADPSALWKIISEQCLPNEREYGQPSPCVKVDIDGGEARGYVVLKDRVGEAQYLLMPSAKITGIEDPAVLAPGAPNYFAAAWDERHFTIEAAKRALRRDALSLAINSKYGRTQNQLHIHIDCLATTVRAAIAKHVAALGETWAPFPEPLAGHPYRALRLAGDTLGANPFILVADSIPGARQAMDKETLIVVGATLPGGVPGFVLLADEANPAKGDHGSSEELQDHSCALAKQ